MHARTDELRDDIGANRVPGGSAFARAGAELITLVLEEAGSPDWDEVQRIVATEADWLTEVKPSMAVVRNAADIARRAAAEAPTVPADAAATAVIAAMRAYIARSERALQVLAGHASDVIVQGSRVLVHSFSASLVLLLQSAAEGTSFELLVTESRPYRESRRLVAAIEQSAVPITLFSDAAVCIAASRADVAIVGADTVFADGSFANKTGSLPLALACARSDVPLYVATELAKLYEGDPSDVAMELRPGGELAGDWDLAESGRVQVWNQFFERVDASLVERYVTEAGLLRPDELLGAAADLS